MGLIATLVRRGSQAEGMRPPRRADEVVQAVPARFEAVGERLAAGHDVRIACDVVGRETARDGADLGEALDGLTATYARVLGGQPDLRAVRALCRAWGEETLGYVHQLSCENPLTGLASRAHLRARLSEVYRGVEQGEGSVGQRHALVVVDLPLLGGTGAGELGPSLWLARLAEGARLVFPGTETIAHPAPTRLVVVTVRSERLSGRVRLLRELVDGLVQERAPAGARARVWVEGLPSTDRAAGHLLDEIART